MDTETIAKIIKRLEAEPEAVITSTVGSGSHGRRMPNSTVYKAVITGDSYSTALLALHYLLFDLGVDVGLSDEELKTLEVK